MVAEQRKAQRIRLVALASFFGERSQIAGINQDLGTKGAQVLTEVALKAGDTVEVDLPVGRGGLREVAGVVWHEPSENSFHPHFLGLELDGIGEMVLTMLEQFAADHKEIPMKIHLINQLRHSEIEALKNEDFQYLINFHICHG